MFLAEEQQSLIKMRQEMEEAANKEAGIITQTSQVDGTRINSPQQVNAKQTGYLQDRQGNLQGLQLHGNQMHVAHGSNQGNHVHSSRHSQGNHLSAQINPLSGSNLESQSSQNVQQMDHSSEEYDEWACIQRELGCLTSEESSKPIISASKRSATSDSRLESLKKFRVDKHSKKTNDIVNNVNVSGHGRNSPQQNYVHVTTTTTQNRTQLHHNVAAQTNTQFIHSSQMSQQIMQNSTHHNVHFSHSTTQHIVQHFTTHTVHHNVHNSNNNSSSGSSNTAGQSVYNTSVHNNYHDDATDEDATQNNSIDEQVQSAIDSILNLQQNTSIDLDDAVSSILS